MENSSNLWRSTGTFCSCMCINCTQTPAARCASYPRSLSDHLMHRLLRRCSLGIQLGEYQLTDLDYADAIAIFAPSICVGAPRSSGNLSGRSQPDGDANQLAEDQTHDYHPNPTNHLPLKICNKEVLLLISRFLHISWILDHE